MSETQRNNDIERNKEDIQRSELKNERSAYVLVYPSAQKCTEETQSTESTTDDEISSISSISMDSALLREELNVEQEEQTFDDFSERQEGKNTSRSRSPNVTKSMSVVSSKKKSSKKEKRKKRTKSLDIDDLDVNNMKFDKGFQEKRKKNIFLETEQAGMEASSNSLLDMFNALDFCESERCDKRSIDSMDMVYFNKHQEVPQTGYREPNFDSAGLSLEWENVDSKIHYSQSQHDTKSRQSKKSTKSTKSKKSKVSKAKQKDDQNAKEYEVMSSSPPDVYRNFKYPLKNSTPCRKLPEQSPIKFRSSRMLMKPDELRSVQSDELSDLESSDFEEEKEEDDRLLDAKSVRSAKSGVSASITVQRVSTRVKEIEELFKPRMEPTEILPQPTPTTAPLVRRSFLSRAISTPFIEAFRRSIDKRDPLEEGSEHLLGEIHDRSITPTRQTRPNFTDRRAKRSSDRSLLTKTRESSHNRMMSLHGGFAGLEEVDDEQPRRPRSGSAESVGKLRNDATGVGSTWRRRFLTDESGSTPLPTKRGILSEDSIHSAKTTRRRGSLGSLGAMVLGTVASTEMSTGVKKRGSTRSLEIQVQVNKIVPTNRRSIRSLGSISLSDDGIETKWPTKPRRRSSVGSLGGPDESESNPTSQPKRGNSNDHNKPRRSHSTDKPRRRHSNSEEKTRRSHSIDRDISRQSDLIEQDKSGEKTRQSHSTDRDLSRQCHSIEPAESGEKTRRSHSTDRDKARRSNSTDREMTMHSHSIEQDKSGEKTRRSHSTDRDKARRSHSTDREMPMHSHSIEQDKSGEKTRQSHSDRKSTRLNSSHQCLSRMPSSA